MKLGTSRVYVGPLLYGLYEGMDSKSREAFKNFVTGASPKHELTATFPSMPAEVAQSYDAGHSPSRGHPPIALLWDTWLPPTKFWYLRCAVGARKLLIVIAFRTTNPAALWASSADPMH